MSWSCSDDVHDPQFLKVKMRSEKCLNDSLLIFLWFCWLCLNSKMKFFVTAETHFLAVPNDHDSWSWLPDPREHINTASNQICTKDSGCWHNGESKSIQLQHLRASKVSPTQHKGWKMKTCVPFTPHAAPTPSYRIPSGHRGLKAVHWWPMKAMRRLSIFQAFTSRIGIHKNLRRKSKNMYDESQWIIWTNQKI